jgi:hypothetical protein
MRPAAAVQQLVALLLGLRLKLRAQVFAQQKPARKAKTSRSLSANPHKSIDAGTWELIRRGLGHDSGETDRARALPFDKCRSLYLDDHGLQYKNGDCGEHTSKFLVQKTVQQQQQDRWCEKREVQSFGPTSQIRLPCGKKCSDEGRKRERGTRVKNLVDKRLSNLLLTVQNSRLQLVQLYHAPRGDFCSSRWPLFSQYILSRRNRMTSPVIARCAPAIVAHSNGCRSSNWLLICGTNRF